MRFAPQRPWNRKIAGIVDWTALALVRPCSLVAWWQPPARSVFKGLLAWLNKRRDWWLGKETTPAFRFNSDVWSLSLLFLACSCWCFFFLCRALVRPTVGKIRRD